VPPVGACPFHGPWQPTFADVLRTPPSTRQTTPACITEAHNGRRIGSTVCRNRSPDLIRRSDQGHAHLCHEGNLRSRQSDDGFWRCSLP